MAKTDLNFRGMNCPMPIMKIAVAFKKASAGDVFEAVCDDPGFEADVRAWCKETGNTLKDLKKEGRDTTVVLEKK